MLPQKLTSHPCTVYMRARTHTHGYTCLGFACGATSVQDEERVLSITPLRLTLIPCLLHEFMPPEVNPFIPRDLQRAEDRNGQGRTVNSSRWGQEIRLPGFWRGQGKTGGQCWEGTQALWGWIGAERARAEQHDSWALQHPAPEFPLPCLRLVPFHPSTHSLNVTLERLSLKSIW